MKKLSDCYMNLEKRDLIITSPSSSVPLKQRFFYIDGQNFDNGYDRNSAGPSSSYDSSSSFESMKVLKFFHLLWFSQRAINHNNFLIVAF